MRDRIGDGLTGEFCNKVLVTHFLMKFAKELAVLHTDEVEIKFTHSVINISCKNLLSQAFFVYALITDITKE